MNYLLHRKDIFKRYWQYVLLGVVIFLYVVTFSYFSMLRHDSFASGFDLSNMDQTIWNTLQGRIFSLTGATGTVSRFSIHADVFLVLLTPLYVFWDNVRMLLIFQSIALGVGAIPVYFISQKLFNKKVISLLFSSIYLLNPGMQWTNIYDFHSVALAIPLLLTTFYFALTRRWRWFFAFALLSLLTKEEISLTIALLGLLIWLIWKERKIGLITFITGIVWFIMMTFVIMPQFSPTHEHWALPLYDNFTSEFDTEHITSLPEEIFLNYLITHDDLTYYDELLKPFAYLPIFGFPWIILSFPDLFINLFSSHAQMRSIQLHYDSGLIPGLMIGTIYSVKYSELLVRKLLMSKVVRINLLYVITGIIVLISLRVNYGYGPLPVSRSCWCIMY